MRLLKFYRIDVLKRAGHLVQNVTFKDPLVVYFAPFYFAFLILLWYFFY